MSLGLTASVHNLVDLANLFEGDIAIIQPQPMEGKIAKGQLLIVYHAIHIHVKVI